MKPHQRFEIWHVRSFGRTVDDQGGSLDDVFVMTLLYMSGGRVEFPIPGLVLAHSI